MVKKQEEMNEAGATNGTSSVSPPQEKRRKNKRKLAEPPSQQNPTDSLIEFPRYELHSLKSQIPICENHEDSSGWDDPFACHLEELLSSNLLTLFRSAMNQIMECGYKEDVVLKAISGSRLYCGGNDLVSNFVNDTLSFLRSGKKGSTSRDYVFEDLQQLVAYTLVEKISLVREVRPNLSTVEAMWRLLMCDLNVLQAFEMEGDGQKPESNPPKPTVSNQSESVKFGNFPSLPNTKNPNANGAAITTEKEVFSASGEGNKSTSSLTSVSDGKLVSCRKARTKKELAMLRQKSCVDKIRTYSKGGGYNKTAKFVGGFLVEKRGNKSLPSSKITTTEVTKTPIAESGSNTKSDTPAVVTALPATNGPTTLATEKKGSSESTKPEPDYYAGIPFDTSLGKYIPRNKRDELILKLAPGMKDLQNELQVWTDWANQKVKQATIRLLKDQPELKSLRKEKAEAEEFRKEKQLLEEKTLKKISEMKVPLSKAHNELEKAKNSIQRLELQQTQLIKEKEAASVRAVESAVSCVEAKERVQRLLKDTQSWEGQKVLLQEEIKSQRDKVVELEQEVSKARNRLNRIEATWKQEKLAKEKLAAQANALVKEREKLVEHGKSEEERIKTKAENDVKYYIENIKRLENEISKLKLKSDGLKIAELKNSSGVNLMAAANVWESNNNHETESKIKRERECVMCLSEEMSVIFLPCAHQVLCSKCNQLHEKEAMEDCPSCRAKIQRRIQARFARG